MAPPRRPGTVIGLDVEKSSHWACVATHDGKVLAGKPIANRESDLDSLFTEFPGALVVVDQVRNIGALALSRARATGMPPAYLPGPAAHEAAKLFGGDAKTDERDETYRYPLTIPRIGPKTASELAISIDIDVFPSHDSLASCCGLAPRNRHRTSSSSMLTLLSIQARLLLNRHRIAAINLGPTGQPRTNVISTIASTGLDLFILRQNHRAWTYYGHPFCQDEKTRLRRHFMREAALDLQFSALSMALRTAYCAGESRLPLCA